MARSTTVRLTASMHALVVGLGRDMRLSTSEVLHRAVGLLQYLVRAERQGAHLLIHDPATGHDERLVFGSARVVPVAQGLSADPAGVQPVPPSGPAVVVDPTVRAEQQQEQLLADEAWFRSEVARLEATRHQRAADRLARQQAVGAAAPPTMNLPPQRPDADPAVPEHRRSSE